MRALLRALGFGAAEKPRDVRSIVAAYGRILETRKRVICDVSELPYSKADIKAALVGALTTVTDEQIKGQFRHAYVSLGDFQDLRDCRQRGVNPDAIAVQENFALAQELKALEASLKGQN